jgi:hypothetical protein
VDLVTRRIGEGAAEILIDGRKPSEYPECYVIDRPAPRAWAPLTVVRVDHDAPLVLEDWALTLISVSEDGKAWEYDVAGSVTGPDGHGSSRDVFVSNSKRVKLSSESFFKGKGEFATGYKITWKVSPRFTDRWEAPASLAPGSESATVVAQGLTNGPHTLEVRSVSGKGLPIDRIRVYRPSLR